MIFSKRSHKSFRRSPSVVTALERLPVAALRLPADVVYDLRRPGFDRVRKAPAAVGVASPRCAAGAVLSGDRPGGGRNADPPSARLETIAICRLGCRQLTKSARKDANSHAMIVLARPHTP